MSNYQDKCSREPGTEEENGWIKKSKKRPVPENTKDLAVPLAGCATNFESQHAGDTDPVNQSLSINELPVTRMQILLHPINGLHYFDDESEIPHVVSLWELFDGNHKPSDGVSPRKVLSFLRLDWLEHELRILPAVHSGEGLIVSLNPKMRGCILSRLTLDCPTSC